MSAVEKTVSAVKVEEKSKGEGISSTVLELLEEDDEFQEFEGGNWEDNATTEEDAALWQVLLPFVIH